jgi:hypothetical protein
MAEGAKPRWDVIAIAGVWVMVTVILGVVLGDQVWRAQKADEVRRYWIEEDKAMRLRAREENNAILLRAMEEAERRWEKADETERKAIKEDEAILRKALERDSPRLSEMWRAQWERVGRRWERVISDLDVAGGALLAWMGAHPAHTWVGLMLVIADILALMSIRDWCQQQEAKAGMRDIQDRQGREEE